MLRLILKRLIFLIPILIGISMISFLITSLSPSDPAEVAIRVNAMVPTPEPHSGHTIRNGLDRPIAVRWVDWITSALHGDSHFRKPFPTPCRGGIFRRRPRRLSKLVPQRSPSSFRSQFYAAFIVEGGRIT